MKSELALTKPSHSDGCVTAHQQKEKNATAIPARYNNCPSFVFSRETTGLNESTKPNDSSKRFGRNQKSYPRIQTNKNSVARTVMRKKIKIRNDTDIYHAKTFRKLGQIGKQTQKRNPPISIVVNRWLSDLSPS